MIERNTNNLLARLVSASAALVLAAGASAQCLPAEIFGPPNTMPVGSLPLGVTVGDLNGDGIPDLLTADFFGNTATFLIGNGDGAFQDGRAIIMVPEGSKEIVGPVHPAIGDLNADGFNDIVIAANNQVGVILNDGKGNFQGPPIYYGFGAMVRNVVITHINDDEFPDIIYSSRDGVSINVLLGVGDGAFLPEIASYFAGGPTGFVIHDFNNDGNIDVAVPLVFDNQVAIGLGDGQGNFVESARYAASSPEWIDIGDVNNDGIADLVTAYTNGDAVQVFIGLKNGAFSDATTIPTGAASLPITVSLADVNNDGFDDILSAAFITNAANLLLSNGDSTFQAPVPFPVGPRPRRFAVADLNNDNALDLIAANGDSNGGVTVILNQCVPATKCPADWNGDDAVNSQDFFDFLTAFFAQDPAADFNNDGDINSQDFFDFIAAFFTGC